MEHSISYKELRAMEHAKARQMVIKYHLDHKQNVSNTARFFQMDRKTVRRIFQKLESKGYLALDDDAKSPKNIPFKTDHSLEELVIHERHQTNYGRIRLARHLQRKHQVILSPHTIRHILKRNHLEKQRKKRSKNRQPRPLYDLDQLYPLSLFQIDTKHILDQKSLPEDVYHHLKHSNLPLYQWTAIDPVTKIRFLCYSHSLSSAYGILFMTLICLWVRVCGIHHSLHFQSDGGRTDFAGTGYGKIQAWNEYLSHFNATYEALTYCHASRQAYVERSHRTDDEEFYIPCLKKITSVPDFLAYAQRYLVFYNSRRSHSGNAMNDRTPLEKLLSTNLSASKYVVHFPIFLLDDLSFYLQKSGAYVMTQYQRN